MRSALWRSFGWKICWHREQRRAKRSICLRRNPARSKSSRNSWSTSQNSGSNHGRFLFGKIKVRSEDVSISEDFSFSWRKEVAAKKGQPLHYRSKDYSTAAGTFNHDQSHQHVSRIVAGAYPVSVNCRNDYPNPIPVAMQSVRIMDLAQVDIHWKMLTVARPSSKLDDEYFTKLVDLEKLRLKARRHAGMRSRRISGFAGGISVRRIIRTNRSGVTEIRLPACLQCGVELCDSANCVKFNYDDFLRLNIDAADADDKGKEPNEPVDDEEENQRIKEENKKDVITSMKGQALKIKEAKKKQSKSKRFPT